MGEHMTTEAAVAVFEAATPILKGLLGEVKTLSVKKSEATLSASKVKLINKVLEDLLVILKGEPEEKYLQLLDDEALPQVSDALLMMVQFDVALAAFSRKYHTRVGYDTVWATPERL